MLAVLAVRAVHGLCELCGLLFASASVSGSARLVSGCSGCLGCLGRLGLKLNRCNQPWACFVQLIRCSRLRACFGELKRRFPFSAAQVWGAAPVLKITKIDNCQFKSQSTSMFVFFIILESRDRFWMDF